MRVLIVCEYASLNGGEHSLLEAARRISAPDLELIVAAPSAGPLRSALQRINLQHVPLDLVDAQGNRPARPELQQRIAACITATGADLLHANSLSMSRLTGPVVQELGTPSIGHLRDIIRISNAAITDLNRHTRLLAVSQATRQWYVAAGLSESKTDVTYNGVDLHRFRPRPEQCELHRELEIPHDAMIVGSIGQMGMRKGVDVYADAAARIANSRSDVHFIHVGSRYSGKEEAIRFEQGVRSAALQGPLRGRFHFLGLRDDVHLILSELAIYVHAARQEPLGRVLLEAGGTETAIIATDVGGTREIFASPKESARLIPPDSSTALTAALEQLLNSPSERLALGRAARQRIEECFDAEGAARRLERHYRQVLSAT